jgi:hypothetical protein
MVTISDWMVKDMRATFSRVLIVVLATIAVIATSSGVADARSTRSASGDTGTHTHATWAGPGVGLIAWTVNTDFTAQTGCGSSVASVTVDSAWNSESLHNGAELDILFSAQRSDGRHVMLGKVFRITKAAPWPGHRAFGGQFHVKVSTPRGMYLKSGSTISWIMNGGVTYGTGSTDTVGFRQFTKRC